MDQGRSFKKGITLIEIFEKFPDEDEARKWFESVYWKGGHPVDHRCSRTNIYEVKYKNPCLTISEIVDNIFPSVTELDSNFR